MPEAVTPPNPAGGSDSDGARHYPGSSEAPGMSDKSSKPDPTLLTIDALRREIAMLSELVDTRFKGERDMTCAEIKRLEDLMDAAEDQRQEQKVDTKDAIDAALAAQKEATGKMEGALTGEINGLRSNFETEVRSIRSTQNDLKDRMTQAESLKRGAISQKDERRESSNLLIAAVGLGVTIVLATITIIGFIATVG